MAESFERKQFSSPEEEIAYLRDRIASRERELHARGGEMDHEDMKAVARQELREYAEHSPEVILPAHRQLMPAFVRGLQEHVVDAKHKVEEVLHIAEEHGIRNALSAIEKVTDSFTLDSIHDALIAHVRGGKRIADFREGAPAWQVLHMTLFSVSLPQMPREDQEREAELTVVVSAMEQLCAGLSAMTAGKGAENLYYSIELAVSDKSDEIVFYMAVPTVSADLFEKQLLSLFPHALITEEKNDYNIFVEGGAAACSVAHQKRHSIYRLRTHDEFDHDPLRVILNAFSKIEREGGGAAIQFLVRPRRTQYQTMYEDVVKRLGRGISLHKALDLTTTLGTIKHFVSDEFFARDKSKDEKPPEIRQDLIELFRSKYERPIDEVIVRIVTSAANEERAGQILRELEASFYQFEHTSGNHLVFDSLGGSAKARAVRAFSFREWDTHAAMPLSERELATLIHLPRGSHDLAPQFKQTQAVSAPAPMDTPQEGTLLGVNLHRNVETKVFMTPADRLRHFYVIGQTGTGKTTIMKNMIMQDINEGNGVCFIDPHGTDVLDVLAAIPPDRADDLIYFDPSHMQEVVGLNMLEYDPRFPEQKTFVINELFSIFQKLYGAVPESMGPIFEQYFRNATALVLEDPESGSTLLDISRVMVDSNYRRLKLSKAKNPVVIQFWRDIATKAGGDAALENIVPYITSKFDVFTANDYMRPIIGQQVSTFNFREIMDNRKILLVNLSKGRLGEINANLIGMIIVGKILMAALSRADSVGKDFAPFYLHIDEFQNITTNSIASILSEARKYKLGLTIAHQYLQQIDEKIRDAVFGNVGSMAVFRVGPEDAEFLEQQFAPTFTKNDLLYIPNRHAYLRLLMNGVPSKPFDIGTMAPPNADRKYADELMRYSLSRFGRPRDAVEAEISARYL